ncbi:MAG: amidase family protein, partial [Nevskia sp.]|nr:amidase family protein [Nevskia sp.]
MHTLSLKELSDGLKAKRFSSRELTRHFLDRIATHDATLNSYITVTAERALAQADAADARLAAGQG